MLAKRLKQLREERHLLQKDIANILKITTSAYGYYEQNRRDPDTIVLQKLADFFDVSTDYLLGRTNIPNYSTIDTLHNHVLDVSKLPGEAIKQAEEYVEFLKQKYLHKK